MSGLKHAIVATSRRVLAEIKALLCSLHSVALDAHRNRDLIEKEIYNGKYKLYSKNDDDLRMVP
jgi:hypothetical protein